VRPPGAPPATPPAGRARRWRAALRAAAGAWTAFALSCLAALPAAAQQRPDAAALAKVHSAAFDHWWPKYEHLMETLIQNQRLEPGRLKVPPPDPEEFRREIHIGRGFSNRYLPGYTFYGVHTQGAVFEGLFLMDAAGTVRVLVNHDDPEDRKPIIEDSFVDHMNQIMDRAEVTVDDAAEAASLARFFLSTFFNFNLHPEDVAVDSTVQDELQRVRVLSNSREIPQGRRSLKSGLKTAYLVFQPVPAQIQGKIRPPVVLRPKADSFLIKLFTWHPVRGEVRSWEILIEDDQFALFRDQTAGRWTPYRFEGMN
jgi:hypothetical protein